LLKPEKKIQILRLLVRNGPYEKSNSSTEKKYVKKVRKSKNLLNVQKIHEK
jgi:hypothetical protein